MFTKHILFFGLLIAVGLLLVATSRYPGGSQFSSGSVGFSWRHNYISDLFAEKAVNGMENPARNWAAAGMFFLCASFAWFFTGYAKRIPNRGASRVIRYSGMMSMVFVFLTVTPYHDLMLVFSSAFMLLSMFYITVLLLKTKLHLFKIFSILLLLVSYLANYLYFARQVDWLPVLQKVSSAGTIAWVLGLHYFTSADDFRNIAARSGGRPL